MFYIGQLEDERIFDMRRRQGRNDKVKATKTINSPSFNRYGSHRFNVVEGKFGTF